MRVALLLFCLVSSASTWAKEVTLKWKSIRGAASYEVRILAEDSAGDREVLSTRVRSAQWQGELDYGSYAYQIRGFDRFGRAGAWSALHSVVAMGETPELEKMKDEHLTLYNPLASIVLRWKAAHGAHLYSVRISQGDRIAYEKTTSDTFMNVSGLAPGSYTWTVLPEVDGRAPASGASISKSWKGKGAEGLSLTIKHETLEVPEQTEPERKIVPARDGKLRIRWKEVEGAQAYDVMVSQIESLISGREPASDSQATWKHYVTQENRLTVPIEANTEGRISVAVRALANYDSSGTLQSEGPQSVHTVILDRDAEYYDGKALIALSTGLAPYTYSVTDPQTGFKGSTSADQVTVRLAGEYWFAPQWGIAPAFETTKFSIFNQSLSSDSLEIVGKYRVKLSGDAHSGWMLTPRAGFALRQFIEVEPVLDNNGAPTSGISTEKFGEIGTEVGFDLRRQFTDRFGITGSFEYFQPLTMVASHASLSGDNLGNYMLGVQGLYWLNLNWGVGLGGYIDDRSINYTINGGAPSPGSVQVNSTDFFGSLVYSFGR